MNLRFLLSATLISGSLLASAQNANRTYAITGNGNGDFLWRNIRQIDLSAGKVVKDIMVTGTNIKILDAISKKEINAAQLEKAGNSTQNNLVAASAFDTRHNKLFFSTMSTGQLRWIDFSDKGSQLKVYYYQDQKFTSPANVNDEAANITRMCIGADGNGYAMSNDGNHFYQFSTGKKPVITDLGNLVDAENNNGISIHNKCSSWGGDVVADAFGKLYVVTASHNVFVVDPATRIASHLGSITGLPGTYTTNGAAVDNDGNIVVSSANSFDGFYKVNFNSLSATKIESTDKIYNASDLANGNLLFQKEFDATNKLNLSSPSILPGGFIAAADARIYPNPLNGSEFKVIFDGQKAGRYNILLTDIIGRAFQTKEVNITKSSQTETVRLNTKPAKGMYMVKVVDASKKAAFTERIVIN